jgi:Co/Zn/Cd efflux system component
VTALEHQYPHRISILLVSFLRPDYLLVGVIASLLFLFASQWPWLSQPIPLILTECLESNLAFRSARTSKLESHSDTSQKKDVPHVSRFTSKIEPDSDVHDVLEKPDHDGGLDTEIRSVIEFGREERWGN